jgi:hypothetical protein
LRRVAEASLNGLLPAEFEPRADSLQVRVAAAAPAPAGGVPRLTLEASRLLARRVSADLVIRAAQGRSAQSALDRLRAQLPLAEAPEIRLEPAWWPWLPLIPFRISVVAL